MSGIYIIIYILILIHTEVHCKACKSLGFLFRTRRKIKKDRTFKVKMKSIKGKKKEKEKEKEKKKKTKSKSVTSGDETAEDLPLHGLIFLHC